MQLTTGKTANDYNYLHIQKESPISLILFLVKNGSRFENEKNNGISHFLEHMMFKPTKNRATSKIISTEIESIGGVSNAFTGTEYTGYYIQVLQENFDKAYEILADLLQNGVLEERDIEIEKGVVTEEIRMYKDSPSDMVGWYAQENVFPDMQLGRPITGTEETVASITRDDLRNFISSHYLQDDFLVVSVGDFDESRVITSTETFLRPRPRGKLEYEPAKFSPNEKINYHERADANQAHTIISFPGVHLTDEKKYEYMLTEAVLGDGMGSILFDLLREQLGVAYYVYASNSKYMDTGIFEIGFGANFDKTKQTVDLIFKELKKLQETPISDDELNRAKNLLYSIFAMQQESVGYLGRKYGMDYLMKGEIETIDEVREKIFSISANDILTTAQHVFNDQYNITYIANKKLL
ncbi:MAG: M16 family metallopeptidase [Candidatus Dojkabacteria bacterium]